MLSGSLRTTVSDASTKTDKVYEIVLESKDSLKERTGVIETKLDALDKKLDAALTPPAKRTAQGYGTIHFKDNFRQLGASPTPKPSP